MYKKRKKIVAVGCPGSFKGFLKEELRKRFEPDIANVSLGALTVSRLEKDADFREKHLSTVERGDLLPDDVAIPMAKAEYRLVSETSNANILYFDGVFRTGAQAEEGIISRMINSSDTIVLYGSAKIETCAKRVNYRDLNETDGKRCDSRSFPNRAKLFEEHLGAVLNAFRNAGIPVITVDANPDLETIVIPKLMEIAVTFVEHLKHPQAPGASNYSPRLSPLQRVMRTHLLRTQPLLVG